MKNRAPYLATAVSSVTVRLNEIMTLDPSLIFLDDDGHSLTINDAYYTFNSVTSPIPDSFFTIVSSKI